MHLRQIVNIFKVFSWSLKLLYFTYCLFLLFQNAEGKVGEYEQQLAALLNSLEEQQRLSDQQTRELEEARQRERKLLSDQKKLELTMKEQDEQIHNLSLNLSQVSKSMHFQTNKHHTHTLN